MAPTDRKTAENRLITALLGGATINDAARQAGIGERTAWRRMADPAFQERLETARRESLQAAMTALERATATAVETLTDLLGVKTAGSTRLGAARAVLEFAVKWREQEELAERLSLLEERLAAAISQPRSIR
jgi:hypothetical protein